MRSLGEVCLGEGSTSFGTNGFWPVGAEQKSMGGVLWIKVETLTYKNERPSRIVPKIIHNDSAKTMIPGSNIVLRTGEYLLLESFLGHKESKALNLTEMEAGVTCITKNQTYQKK